MNRREYEFNNNNSRDRHARTGGGVMQGNVGADNFFQISSNLHDRNLLNLAEILKESILKHDLSTFLYYIKRTPPNIEDKNGESLLHIAVLNSQTEAIRQMIYRGWDLNATDKLGQTVLHKAATMGYVEVLNLLCMNIKDDLNKKCTHRGFTALHCAAYNGFPQSISIIVYHGAKLEPLDRLISTPAHVACQAGHLGCLLRLLEMGSNPNHKNIFGDTLLHASVRYGHLEIVRTLLSNTSVDANKKNRNGDTALHVAISLKREIIASLLINHGARVDIRNMQDLLPIELISDRKEYSKLVSLLKKAKKKKTKQIYNETTKHQKYSIFNIFRKKRHSKDDQHPTLATCVNEFDDNDDNQGLALIKAEAPIYPMLVNLYPTETKAMLSNFPPLVRSRSDESLHSGNNRRLRKENAWNIQAHQYHHNNNNINTNNINYSSNLHHAARAYMMNGDVCEDHHQHNLKNRNVNNNLLLNNNNNNINNNNQHANNNINNHDYNNNNINNKNLYNRDILKRDVIATRFTSIPDINSACLQGNIRNNSCDSSSEVLLTP